MPLEDGTYGVLVWEECGEACEAGAELYWFAGPQAGLGKSFSCEQGEITAGFQGRRALHAAGGCQGAEDVAFPVSG